jgi:hypothetical protein
VGEEVGKRFFLEKGNHIEPAGASGRREDLLHVSKSFGFFFSKTKYFLVLV